MKVPGIVRRALVIGDTHLPAEHQDYLPFCRAVAKRINPTHVFHVGDLFEWQALKYHERDPDMISAGSELEWIRKRIKPWIKAFPKVYMSIGNHDVLPQRQAKSAGIPQDCLKSWHEMYDLPEGWVVEADHEAELPDGTPFVVQHDFSSSLNSGAAQLNGCCVAAGHYHHTAGVGMASTPERLCWYLATGCGIDWHHPAYAYSRKGAGLRRRPLLGCGVVLDGQAYWVPMRIVDGRWDRKVTLGAP